MLDIKFIGTGGAFNVRNGNSSVIVRKDGVSVLVDCGHFIFPEIVKNGLVNKVDYVLITHLHDDHAGSLSSLILYYQIVLQKGNLKLIYPSEKFRETITGFLSYSLGHPEDRLEFVPIEEFEWIGAIDTFGKHVANMQTWSYYFKGENSSIVYSGDLGDADFLFAKIKELGLKSPRVFHELSFDADVSSHTYYKLLEKYLAEYEIYGYHCDPEHEPDDNKIPLVANIQDLMIS